MMGGGGVSQAIERPHAIDWTDQPTKEAQTPSPSIRPSIHQRTHAREQAKRTLVMSACVRLELCSQGSASRSFTAGRFAGLGVKTRVSRSCAACFCFIQRWWWWWWLWRLVGVMVVVGGGGWVWWWLTLHQPW